MSSRSSEESTYNDDSESESIEIDSGSEMSNTTSSQLSTSYSWYVLEQRIRPKQTINYQ